MSLPTGYRQGIVTAITVFLGFSLAFIRFWGIENPGVWTAGSVLSAVIVGLGILVQVVALFRALDVRDDELGEYRKTVRVFRVGVMAVILGVVVSILVAV
jgi:uncharacterized membrane protein YidH (DUF202 family)